MQSTATTSTIPHPLSSLSDLENDAHVSDHTDAAHEPLLCVDNIQGNGLAGFKKDHQRFLLLSIVPGQAAAFKTWLGTQVNSFATAAEVLAFNRLFKALKDRRGSEGTVSATWTNVLFTAKGLRLVLAPTSTRRRTLRSSNRWRRARQRSSIPPRTTEVRARGNSAVQTTRLTSSSFRRRIGARILTKLRRRC